MQHCTMISAVLTTVADPPDRIDVYELLIGDAHGWSLAALAVRSALMFIFALLLIRLTGKRSLGQLSPFDFVIIIALGSAVGDPMLYRDVPLADAAVVVVVVVILNVLISNATQRWRRLEEFTDSTASVLIRDGTIDESQLRSENLSMVELGEALRLQGVADLADVRLAVLEPSGSVSVLTTEHAADVDLWRRFSNDSDDRWK